MHLAIILRSVLFGATLLSMSWLAQADSMRISTVEFAKDPDKVEALQQGLAKMRSNNLADPSSAQFRTSFVYWANTHGYFGNGKHATDLTKYIARRMPGCLQIMSKDECEQYYQHMQNSTVPNDGFTEDVWGTCQHGNLNFLPWHRMMLYFYERTLRKYVGADFSLPYWDYYQEHSSDGQGLALTALVRGEQADSLYDQYRTPGLNTNSRAIDPDNASAAQAFSYEDFTSFSNELQNQPHGVMHCAVGESCVLPDMGFVPIAGLDPVFYMHHANIDRLWQCWLNRKANGQTIDLAWAKKNLGMPDSWYDISYTFADENGAKVSMTIADVFTPGKIPVQYANETQCDIQAPLNKKIQLSTEAKTASAFKADHGPVSSNKSVHLMGVSQKVALKPQIAKFKQKSVQVKQMQQAPGQSFLILDDVQMVDAPHLTYKIYLSSDRQPEERLYVATINYFGVLDHDPSGHIGQLVYHVSDQVKALATAADHLNVHFVATDLTTGKVEEKASESGLSIGQIRLETALH